MILDTLKELKQVVADNKNSEKVVLIKKGVFDIIHPGHIFAIGEFCKIADVVIILIQSDTFTAKKKGPSRPVNPQPQRAEVIDGLKGVDYVYLDSCESREEYINLLKEICPSIVAVTAGDSRKSVDYQSNLWKLMEFPDKNLPGYSTTEIINRVIMKCKLNEKFE